ncbi:zinc finger protein [Saccharothrix violaceirubra]|uniref:zinc finger protein n=1 Tax=Saccharothrix violaceirubra TaxID=413306 RepID=UPI001611F436|nr:zinc finger protein [Saccharothrix violaceirubra]
MSSRQFRWLPHEGHRHAVQTDLVAGRGGTTLCGLAVTAPTHPPPRYPDGCRPTCALCDAAWRRAEGIPIRAEGRPSAKSVADARGKPPRESESKRPHPRQSP